MQKSRNESLANHIGPESCTVSGNAGGEALTGVRTGWVLSREMKLNPGADVLQDNERQHCTHRYGKGYAGPAKSETPRMYRDTLHGSREALHSTFEFWKVRIGKPYGGKAMTYECRESDSPIVSEKPSNKIRDNKRMAEEVEKRGLAKGNRIEQNRGRTLCRETLQSELDKIRQSAKIMIIHQGDCASLPEAGAQCVSSARWDLCGGRRVTGVPTVTRVRRMV